VPRAAPDDNFGHVTSAIWLLHEAVWLGGADEVAPRITALVDSCDSSLAAARALYVHSCL